MSAARTRQPRTGPPPAGSGEPGGVAAAADAPDVLEAAESADPAAAEPHGPVAPTRTAPLALALCIRFGPAVIPAAVMTGLGLWDLARDSDMGNDEVASRWAAGLSLRELARLLSHVDAVHGLYYLFMHCWLVIGGSPAVLRIPSVLAMAVAAALAAMVARRLTGSAAAGLFAGLVLALTPSISFYAQTARSYALVLACVLGATLALLRALKAAPTGAQPARLTGAFTIRRWAGYGALMVLAIYLNEMAVLVLAAHLVTLLLIRPGRDVLLRWLTVAAAAVVIAMPLVFLSYTQDAAVAWIARPGLGALRTLFRDYFGPSLVVSLLLVLCALLALLPGHGRPARPAAGVVALPLLMVPAGLLLAESLVAPPLYVDRYVLYGEAGAAILAGAGIARLGSWLARFLHPRWRAVPLALPGLALCALVLVLQLGAQQFDRTPASRLFNFGGPSQYIGAHSRPGDGVLYLNTLFRKAELGYPADFRGVADFGVATTPEQAGNFRGTDKPFSVTRQLMLRRRRIWVIGAGAPSEHLQSLPQAQESRLLLRDFSLVATRHYRGITVTLWVRR